MVTASYFKSQIALCGYRHGTIHNAAHCHNAAHHIVNTEVLDS